MGRPTLVRGGRYWAVAFLIGWYALGFLAGSACTRARTVAAPEPMTLPAPSGAAPSPPDPAIFTPEYGSVLVIYRTAEGEERTITCGGEVSYAPKQLLKLDRSGP